MKKLPPFRKAVEIRFMSLRPGRGYDIGIVPDCDTMVKRVCYRQRIGDSWKWVIRGFDKIPFSELHLAEVDQDILDEGMSDLELLVC